MPNPIRLLVIEDSEDDYRLLLRALSGSGFEYAPLRVYSEGDFKKALESPWDLIISDYNIPGFGGLQALSIVRQRDQDTPFILMSGTIGEDKAVEAMKAGANDYFMKGHSARLIPVVTRELKDAEQRQKARLELKERETQLRQAQKMEAVGQLAGGIAHDFNNMLGAIALYCDLIDDEPGTSKAVLNGIQEIRQVADRGAKLTRQLLVFSRRQVVQPQTIDLNGVISGLKNMLSRLIGENIKIVLELSGSLQAIKADAGQLEQILMNLIVNARDAMPEGGQVIIETGNIHLKDGFASPLLSVGPGDYVSLSVTDTGHGMDAKTVARIFEPFFTTKPPGKGTGLGLATVYGILKQSGGALSVQSEPGKGTVFKAYLPISDETARAASPQATDRKDAGSLGSQVSILLVEDDERLRSLVLKVLKREGCEVISAENGEVALQLCQKHPGPIHLLLTDVVMPGMSGFELAKKARDLRGDLRVLFMSGYANEALEQSGKWVTSDFVLIQKPFNAGDLVSRIKGILSAKPTGP